MSQHECCSGQCPFHKEEFNIWEHMSTTHTITAARLCQNAKEWLRLSRRARVEQLQTNANHYILKDHHNHFWVLLVSTTKLPGEQLTGNFSSKKRNMSLLLGELGVVQTSKKKKYFITNWCGFQESLRRYVHITLYRLVSCEVYLDLPAKNGLILSLLSPRGLWGTQTRMPWGDIKLQTCVSDKNAMGYKTHMNLRHADKNAMGHIIKKVRQCSGETPSIKF